LRVVVPYTKLTPGCVESLRWHCPHAERVVVSASPLDYWRLLCRVWADQEDAIIVEHDMSFDAEAIEVLETCPEQLCTSAPCFQMIRFRSELMRAAPRMFESIPPSERHWLALEYCSRDRLPARHRHAVTPPPFNDSGRRWIDRSDVREVVWFAWLRTLPSEHADRNTARAWAAIHRNPDGTDDGRACSRVSCKRAGRVAFPSICDRCGGAS
jgi:hypothetical protein